MNNQNTNENFEQLNNHWSSMDDPRENARQQMLDSVGMKQWVFGRNYASSLREIIFNHSVATNPMINAMNEGKFSFNSMKEIHLEYRHAIVQIFTDALLKLIFNCEQLDSQLKPGSKQPPRFLILLNVLDEFGFLPGLDNSGYYKGNPKYAHYPLFEEVLYEYDISDSDRLSYKPSDISTNVRQCLESCYDSVAELAAMLATAEIQVMLFSPPLRENTAKLGIDTNEGYYMVHGCAENGQEFANDDDHETDLWLLVAMLLKPEDMLTLETQVLKYCDLWDEFWLQQHDRLSQQ